MDLSQEERQIPQVLEWGSLHQERQSPADVMFVTTGRRIYVIGDIDGRFRPRSNPYDLYTFGKPGPDDPLANKLQGVWAQPVKGINQYGCVLEWADQRWRLDDAERFTQSFADVRFDFQRGPIQAIRRDFAAQDQPLLFSTLTLRNQGKEGLDLRAAFQCEFDLEDAWFTHLAPVRNTGETVSIEAGCLVARSLVLPDRWAAAVGAAKPPDEIHLLEGSMGELVYRLHLAPGAEETLVFGMVVESQGGAVTALNILSQGLSQSTQVLAENQACYAQLFESGPHLNSPDPQLNAAFDLAQANLRVLEAEQPGLERYFYAGLEMFPFWFGGDGAYSLIGLMIGGQREAALNHVRLGQHFQEGDGRIPHQLSPAGHMAFSGSVPETPLWVMSVWDAYRWTGDRAFLAEMYPAAVRGMFDFILGVGDPDGDGYPSGPGVVEVEGMGPEKLDSAAYTWSGLLALANMAETMGDETRARLAREKAVQIERRFDADWWDQPSGTYAMSLLEDNTRFPVPHWAVIVPLEVGLAAPDHAAQTFATLRDQYLNRWGLKHTAGRDERVWTLPTATLSRACYRYGETGLGVELLGHVAETLDHGSIGVFHELIPQGACFVQLWSGATFLRGIVEDLLGIQVDAAHHHMHITPQLPEDWDAVGLDHLTFGNHRVSIKITRESILVEQEAGSAPLSVDCRLPDGSEQSYQL